MHSNALIESWNYGITTAQGGYPETGSEPAQGFHKARQDMTGHDKPRMAPDLCTPHTGRSLSAVSLVVPKPAPCYPCYPGSPLSSRSFPILLLGWESTDRITSHRRRAESEPLTKERAIVMESHTIVLSLWQCSNMHYSWLLRLNLSDIICIVI